MDPNTAEAGRQGAGSVGANSWMLAWISESSSTRGMENSTALCRIGTTLGLDDGRCDGASPFGSL
jgi:hypothetical protein